MKYRHKPTEIEAIQLRWDTWSEMCDFIGVGYLKDGKPEGQLKEENKIGLAIPTLEGVMTASEGDYIVKGPDGDFWPIKPDIFEKRYEPVTDIPHALGDTL